MPSPVQRWCSKWWPSSLQSLLTSVPANAEAIMLRWGTGPRECSQSWTLVALDAGVLWISLGHENYANFKRKRSYKEKKYLDNTCALKKTDFCICHSERTSCFLERIHPKKPVLWDPRLTNQCWAGNSSIYTETHWLQGSRTSHFAGMTWTQQQR